MVYIEWNDQLAIGIAELDDEHKYFIVSIDELHASIAAGRPLEEQMKMLGDVLEYFVAHATREEEQFSSTEYPDGARHIQLHAEFINRITMMLSRLREEANPEIIRDALLLLKKWTLDHIQNVDLQYVPYLKAKQHQAGRKV